MARVTEIQPDDKSFNRLHNTGLVCRYLIGYVNGQRILQLNSYGSEGRQNTDSVSQTFQFDEHSARQLFDVLREEFGF